MGALTEAEELELLELEESMGLLGSEGEEATAPQAEPVDEVNPLTVAKEFPKVPEGHLAGEFTVNEKLNDRMAKRDWDDKQTQESVDRGDISPLRATVNFTGNKVGAAFDIAFAPVFETFEGAANLAGILSKGVTDLVGEDFLDKGLAPITGTANAVSSARDESEVLDKFIEANEIAAEGAIDFVKGNAESIADFYNGLDKEDKKTMASGANLALLIPSLGKVASQGVTSIMDSAGKVVTRKLGKQLGKGADDLVLATDKASKVKRQTRTGTSGYGLTATEKAESDAVTKVKGFNPKLTVEQNHARIVDAQERAGKLLQAEVNSKGVAIDPTRVNVGTHIDAKKVIDLEPDYRVLTAEQKKVPFDTVDDMITIASEKLYKTKGLANRKVDTAVLHEARKRIGDKINWNRDVKGSTNYKDDVYRSAYDTFNKMIDQSMPTKAVPEFRNTYHQLSKVNSKVSSRIIAEEAQRAHNMLEFIGNTARELWAAKTVDRILLGGAVAASGAGAGTLGSVLAAGWGIKKGVAVITDPKLKRMFISMNSQVSSAIKKAAGQDRKNLIEVKRYLIKQIANSAVQDGEQK